MKQHPLSAAFPALSEEELAALADDIRDHGLRDPIVMHEGMVLDGWHRYLACEKVGAMPMQIDYTSDDPVAFVRSKNFHRRHMSTGQRAASIIELSEWRANGVRGQAEKAGENSPPAVQNGKGKTNAQMAAEAGVGKDAIKAAKQVHASGADELKEAVRKDEIAIFTAAEIAKLPEGEQAAAVQEMKRPKTKGAKKKNKPATPVHGRRIIEAQKKIAELGQELAARDARIEQLKAEKERLAAEIEQLKTDKAKLEARIANDNHSFGIVNRAAKLDLADGC